MSDMDFNKEPQPEEESFNEAASQALESAGEGLEQAVEPVVEAAEDSAVLVGDVIETAAETGAEAGEVVEKAAGELESAWEPEPVDFSTVVPEPPVEPSEAEIPPASPAWQPEPPRQSQVPPPVPPAPVRATAEALSADDERTWALLAHLSVLLNLVTGILGPVAAIVIYFAFKDRSRFVRYHAMQSFLFQLLFWVGGGILATTLWVISIPLMVVIVGFCLIPFALVASLLPLAALVYGVIGGIQVSQGQDFRYWLVGDWVRGRVNRRLAPHPQKLYDQKGVIPGNRPRMTPYFISSGLHFTLDFLASLS